MWVNCDERMPKETRQGQCMVSEMVDIELSDGTFTKDCLINGKWVIYCKNSCKIYPIKWYEKPIDLLEE